MRDRVERQLVLCERLRGRYDVVLEPPLELRTQARNHGRNGCECSRRDDYAPRVEGQFVEHHRRVHQPNPQAIRVITVGDYLDIVALGHVAEHYHDGKQVLQLENIVLHQPDPAEAECPGLRLDLHHAAIYDVHFGNVKVECLYKLRRPSQGVVGLVVPIPAVNHSFIRIALPTTRIAVGF
ncbi:hypothetical protein BOVATA_005040 [Babesia ovata]|uniref:Uncharacterized protein n=1 Tax=Babesia ovata TaxID=189622 RepID=A0A2H6K7N7_9APIC|nr:uncharacterized protein BOVATA_005040 [Babesia ovata]GBE59011.1 hypothetical protein BOVATA_005040 [Babesia ovata]